MNKLNLVKTIFNNNPLYEINIINNSTELLKLSSILDLTNKLNFYYLNRKSINNILYENENYIWINNQNDNIKLSDCFVLNLLIKNNPDLINYIYNISFIEKINNFKKDFQILTKLIFSKLILVLTNNFKNSEYCNYNSEIEINKIEESNKSEISENISTLREFGLYYNLLDIININIDRLYIEIILGLIKSHIFDNYNKALSIIEQLELENIGVTEAMMIEFLPIFNYDFYYIKEYMISKIDDLNNEKKINFYYFLLKYIFKHSFFIYNIPLLLLTRHVLIKKIKCRKYLNKLISLNFKNIENKKRMEYVLKTILDTDYYYLKYFSIIIGKLTTLKYYFLFLQKNEQINEINEIINNKNGYYEKYLKDYEKAKQMICKIVKYILEKQYGEIYDDFLNSFINNESFILNNYNYYIHFLLDNILEKSNFELFRRQSLYEYKINNINGINFDSNEINYNKLEDIVNNNKEIRNDKVLYTSISSFLNFLKQLKIRIINEYNNLQDINIILEFNKEMVSNDIYKYNISCIYSILEYPKLSCKDENILIDYTNTKTQGFQFFMEHIKNISEKKDDKKSSNYLYSTKNISYIKNQQINIQYQDKKAIIELKEEPISIFNKNGYILIGGNQHLILYNENNIEINNYEFKEIITSFILLNSQQNIEIIVHNSNTIYKFEIEINSKKNVKFNVKKIKMSCKFLLQLDESKYIICNEKNVKLYNDLFDNNIIEKENNGNIIIESSYQRGITINKEKKIILLQHNEIVGGKYKFLIYDVSKKQNIYILENEYLIKNSVIYFILDMYLSISKAEGNTFNGILIIINIENYKGEVFINTFDVQINCFCPIVINEKNVFLVAGGCENNIGKIILYKVINNSNEPKLKHIQEFEYDCPIINITFQNEKKTLFILCSNKKVYLNDKIEINC